jgi:hypothetical protein
MMVALHKTHTDFSTSSDQLQQLKEYAFDDYFESLAQLAAPKWFMTLLERHNHSDD